MTTPSVADVLARGGALPKDLRRTIYGWYWLAHAQTHSLYPQIQWRTAVEERDFFRLHFLCSLGMEAREVAFNVAAAQGDNEVIEFLRKRVGVLWGDEAVEEAVMGGHLATVVFLRSFRPQKARPICMEYAAIRGDLEMLKYLCDDNCERGLNRVGVMDAAAAAGHLEIVRFVHETNLGQCTSNAMREAAARGYLDIVQFLLENRTEGGEQLAIYEASARNHLRVVRFLCEEKGVVPQPGVLDIAIKNGNIETIQFLAIELSVRSEYYAWLLEEVITPDGTLDVDRFGELYGAVSGV
jgi:hypothetical protein